MIKLVLLVIYIVLLHKHSCSFKNKSRSMHYKLLWTAFEFRYNCYSKSNLNKLWVWIHLHLLISEFLFKETYKYRSSQEISQNVWNVQDKQMPQGIVGSSTWSTRREQVGLVWRRMIAFEEGTVCAFVLFQTLCWSEGHLRQKANRNSLQT